ncbi:hypothetical protein H2248_007499 [Termitomyces sp. 'cryptogamus']|nr:hypothetical protein H2248_007499 [Termitomyces sp. 'cryptogamus']
MKIFENLLTSLVCLVASQHSFASAIQTNLIDVATFNWKNVKFVYAFGDSYSFVQGALGHPNFSFIGDLQHLSFTPHQILSNEIIARNTSSEGSNWLEFLTGCFSGNPNACPTQLWDFAFAGSDIDGVLLPLHHIFTVPLVDQVNQWIAYASMVLPHLSNETLTTWWIGINDTGDTTGNTTITNFTAFWEEEMTSYFKAELAYSNGLKNHLFINVPPGYRAPASIGNSKAPLLKAHTDLYNMVLAEHVAAFAANHTGAAVLSFDANTWFNTILDNAAEYGFTDITGFCTCADPKGFFWYSMWSFFACL